MTTIAYKDGILAGDGRETNVSDPMEGESAIVVNHNCRKVFKLKDGRLFGASRCSEDIVRLHTALENNHPPPKLEDINALMIDLKGQIWLYEGNIWQRVNKRYYAVGSGSVFAFPILWYGGSAIDAAKAGVEFDPYSGGKVTSVRLSKK